MRISTSPESAHTTARRARRSRRVTAAASALAAVAAVSGCADLLDAGGADALVQLEARDAPAVMRIRQDVLAGAPTWGGVRVGEQTGDVGESALEFTLPGENLDIALGALDQIDARVVSTEIDVEARQIERTTTTAADSAGRARAAAPDAGQVRLRVEVAEQPAEGVGSLLRALMAVFTVIGVVATFRWVGGLRSRTPRRSREIERLDLREDPPTQETPRVPPVW